jgi:serine/threonine protein kinase
VCHRDLKPENILFRGSNVSDVANVAFGEGAVGFHEPVITDFGLAVSLEASRL